MPTSYDINKKKRDLNKEKTYNKTPKIINLSCISVTWVQGLIYKLKNLYNVPSIFVLLLF